MILRDLPALAASIGDQPPSGDAGGGFPFVDPRLVCTYQPARMWRTSWSPPEPDDKHGHGRWARMAGPWGEGAPLGSSPARNSDTPPKRNGWKGLTAAGRREIRRSCAVLDDAPGRLVFWTVTLTPEQRDRIQERDSWPQFQEALRHRLVRRLHARGTRAWVIGVVELHPISTAREGRPCPHVHVCFEGRAHRRGRWWLSIEELDGIILQALRAAGWDGHLGAASGNTQAVRRSVGRYLAKYMSKGGDDLGRALSGWELCPRQWWFRSRGLKVTTERLRVVLPRDFVAWIHGQPERMERMGWGSWTQLSLPDGRAPNTYAIAWRDCAALAAAMAAWQESVWDAEWRRTLPLLNDSYHPGQHPQRD